MRLVWVALIGYKENYLTKLYVIKYYRPQFTPINPMRGAVIGYALYCALLFKTERGHTHAFYMSRVVI